MNFFRKIQVKMRDGTLRQMLRELQWVGAYSLRYRWSVALYLFLGLFSVAMSLGAGVVSKRIIDAVTGFDSSALLPAAVAYGVMQLLRIGSGVWVGRINASVRLRVEQQIRSDVYDRVMNTDYEAISAFHSGDLLSRTESDVATVAASVLGWLPDFLTKAVQLFGTLGIILYYDGTLALLALLSAPVTLLLSGVAVKRLRGHNQRMRSAGAQLTAFQEESFQNVQPIKSFGLGEAYGRRLRQLQARQHGIVMRYTRFQTGAIALMNLVGTAVSALCFGWGVYRLWNGHITYGTMMLFMQMAGSLSGAFSALVQLFPTAIAAATAAGRIMAITQLPQEDRSRTEEAEELRKNGRGGVTVAVRDVRFRYASGKPVLEGATFRAEPGQIVALIGPSGEGKTTILRLLLGILRPEAGSLTVSAGERTMEISPSTRSLFAYVPQSSSLFSGTVRDNLCLMNPDATDEELYAALKLACADGFVRALPLGLDAPVHEQGGGFSQGQIQRLMLARAMLSKAPALLLDEATSALDAETESRVLENILKSKRHRTYVVTTHRMSVLDQCDRVYRIHGGRTEEIENHNPEGNGNG